MYLKFCACETLFLDVQQRICAEVSVRVKGRVPEYRIAQRQRRRAARGDENKSWNHGFIVSRNQGGQQTTRSRADNG